MGWACESGNKRCLPEEAAAREEEARWTDGEEEARWTNRSSYIDPRGIMQFLGMGIAHGADEELVFAFMTATSFHYSIRPDANRNGGDEDNSYEEAPDSSTKFAQAIIACPTAPSDANDRNHETTDTEISELVESGPAAAATSQETMRHPVRLKMTSKDGAVTWSAEGLSPSVHSAWSPQTLAPVVGPIVHVALRCTWVGGACTCSKQYSVVWYSLCHQIVPTLGHHHLEHEHKHKNNVITKCSASYTSRSTHTSTSASVLELCQQRSSTPSQAHFIPGCIA